MCVILDVGNVFCVQGPGCNQYQRTWKLNCGIVRSSFQLVFAIFSKYLLKKDNEKHKCECICGIFK